MVLQKEYQVEITGMSSDGRGIARIDGQVVFVPGAILGEICLVKIVNIGKHAAHAELLCVEQPSPHRITPDCPYFPECGGCALRHMDYAMELEIKRQRVYDALSRIGGYAPETLEIAGAAETEGYRNKVQYPVQEQNRKVAAGFYRSGTHQVIPISHCRIQPDCADRIRSAVLDWMAKYHISAYEETSHRG